MVKFSEFAAAYANTQIVPREQTEETFQYWRSFFKNMAERNHSDTQFWAYDDKEGRGISSENPSFSVAISYRPSENERTNERYVFIGQGDRVQVYLEIRHVEFCEKYGESTHFITNRSPWVQTQKLLPFLYGRLTDRVESPLPYTIMKRCVGPTTRNSPLENAFPLPAK